MNRAVDAWNKHESQPKYKGPDSVVVEDQKIALESEDEKDGREKVADDDASN